MAQLVDHQAMPVVGFAAPWHVRAGAAVTLHLSATGPLREAAVIRLDLPSPRRIDWAVKPLTPVRNEELDHGSYLRVRHAALLAAGDVEGIKVELLLTSNPGRRVVLASDDLRLMLDGDRLILESEGIEAAAVAPVPTQQWMALRLRRGEQGTSISVIGSDVLAPLALHGEAVGLPWPGIVGDLLFGTGPDQAGPSLNARLARPALETAGGMVTWRFPTILPDGPVPSEGPERLPIEAVNLPTFCVTSPRWDGSSFDPRLVPDHYDAVHLHDDDLGPLDWPASFAVDVPHGAAPGVYAFEIQGEGATERIPFFVRAARPTAPLVVLLPTATYLAYADEALPEHLYPWMAEDRGHRFAQGNRLRSLYDFHDDLSGVTLASWRRPKATVRDDHVYPLCGCPHGLAVDLRLLRLLHAEGVPFDLLTDHDLDAEGLDALRGHRAVATGSHPEYMSVRMEGAHRAFAAEGGSILYLGGNGFAATVAFRGDLLELRRSPLEAGRTWDGPVAEQALALTNEPGGFLRNRGRGEFSLVGGAISLMGFGPARPFRRTAASRGPDCAWLFDGVAGDAFGEEGVVLGGAAGYEVDATDPRLGTHPETRVVAVADDFGEDFYQDPSRWYPKGEAEMRTRRVAEMTLRLLPAGGLIFSASSVAWLGALPEPGLMNDVGRITMNAIRRATRPDRPPSPEET